MLRYYTHKGISDRPDAPRTGDVLEGLGWPRPSVSIPVFLVMLIAYIVEYVVTPIAALFGKTITTDFTVNRMLVRLRWASAAGLCLKAAYESGRAPVASLLA